MRYQRQFFRTLFFLLLLICLLSGLVGVVGVPVSAAPPLIYPASSVVISEFRTIGSGGGDDEFIELYNPTASAVPIGTWTLQKSVGCGMGTTLLTAIPAGVTLAAGQYYLIGGTTYSGAVTPDIANVTLTIDDNGGIALRNGATIVDQVGMCTATLYVEGTFLPALTTNVDRGYERRIGGANGSCQDDANNLTDFSLITPSAPQNSSSPVVLCGVPTPTITNTPTFTATASATSTATATPSPTPAEVIISEVAWSGTQASTSDEWIELYNTRNSSIDLTGWRLVNSTGSVDIVLSGTIPPKGFFLLERAHEQTVNDVTADQLYLGALGDINDSLTLSRPNGAIIDTANSDGGPWPAGTGSPNFSSMERVVTGGVPAKDTASGWISNTQASTWTKHDAAGGLIHGTPAGNNWAFSVVPTPSPKPPPATSTPGACNVSVNPTSIIINEIAWAGTAASTSDEWIELYNPTASTINLNGWVLRAVDGTPNIALANVDLPAGQYYLLERTDDTTVSDIIADQIFTGDIGNFSESLRLFNQFGVCVDAANSNGGAWPAGSSITFGTMERRGVVPDSDTAWITNTGVKANGHDAGFPNTCTLTPPCSTAPKPLKGTPRQANWAISVTPTASPRPTSTPRRTATPTRVFIPAPPPPLIGINEFVPRPGHDWNNDGTINVGDEYIELINHGVVDVNLGGYSIDDEANIGSLPYRLPSVVLKPGQRMVFYGEDTGLLLSDGGDGVRLLKPNGQLGDAYNYTVVKYPDQSYCRLPDNGGLDDWNQNCFPTPGLQNSLSGSFVRPPTETNVDEQLCPIADMLPSDFILAECPLFGNIWSRYYWDKDGWYGEKVIPDINSKWDVYVD